VPKHRTIYSTEQEKNLKAYLISLCTLLWPLFACRGRCRYSGCTCRKWTLVIHPVSSHYSNELSIIVCLKQNKLKVVYASWSTNLWRTCNRGYCEDLFVLNDGDFRNVRTLTTATNCSKWCLDTKCAGGLLKIKLQSECSAFWPICVQRCSATYLGDVSLPRWQYHPTSSRAIQQSLLHCIPNTAQV
jgi:hypothetical protein